MGPKTELEAITRIAIVEDHLMFRQGLKMALELCADFKVVREASCGAEYEKLYDPDQIDITLLDLRLNGQNGAITCQNLQRKYPGIKIIIISFSEDPDLILQMIRYGASAYIPKGNTIEYVEHTIRMVMQYQFYFDRNLGEMMMNEMKKAYKKRFIGDEFRVEFNEVEMRIAMLACSGLTNDQVAENLNLTRRSVENHRTNMQLKTDSANFQGVVIYMFKHYLLFPQQF